MDLGSLLGDLATTYIKTKYATPPQVMVSGGQPYMQPADFQVGPYNIDPLDLLTDPATGAVVATKKKKCRRRRRRLATVSDIRDLAALKSILGNGESFRTWIATHSR